MFQPEIKAAKSAEEFGKSLMSCGIILLVIGSCGLCCPLLILLPFFAADSIAPNA